MDELSRLLMQIGKQDYKKNNLIANLFQEIIALEFNDYQNYMYIKRYQYDVWIERMNLVVTKPKFEEIIRIYHGIINTRNAISLKYRGMTFDKLLLIQRNMECDQYINRIIGEWINKNRVYFNWSTNYKLNKLRKLYFSDMNPVQKTLLELQQAKTRVIIDRNPHFFCGEDVEEIRVPDVNDSEIVSHELGHYCLCAYLKKIGVKNSYSISCNELVAIMYEIYSCFLAGNNKDAVKNKYIHMLEWMDSLAQLESEMYTENFWENIHFRNILKDYFQDVNSNNYFDYIWMSQAHLVLFPGYVYSYRVAIASALKIIEKCNSVFDIQKVITDLMEKYNSSSSHEILSSIWM